MDPDLIPAAGISKSTHSDVTQFTDAHVQNISRNVLFSQPGLPENSSSEVVFDSQSQSAKENLNKRTISPSKPKRSPSTALSNAKENNKSLIATTSNTKSFTPNSYKESDACSSKGEIKENVTYPQQCNNSLDVNLMSQKDSTDILEKDYDLDLELQKYEDMPKSSSSKGFEKKIETQESFINVEFENTEQFCCDSVPVDKEMLKRNENKDKRDKSMNINESYKRLDGVTSNSAVNKENYIFSDFDIDDPLYQPKQPVKMSTKFSIGNVLTKSQDKLENNVEQSENFLDIGCMNIMKESINSYEALVTNQCTDAIFDLNLSTVLDSEQYGGKNMITCVATSTNQGSPLITGLIGKGPFRNITPQINNCTDFDPLIPCPICMEESNLETSKCHDASKQYLIRPSDQLDLSYVAPCGTIACKSLDHSTVKCIKCLKPGQRCSFSYPYQYTISNTSSCQPFLDLSDEQQTFLSKTSEAQVRYSASPFLRSAPKSRILSISQMKEKRIKSCQYNFLDTKNQIQCSNSEKTGSDLNSGCCSTAILRLQKLSGRLFGEDQTSEEFAKDFENKMRSKHPEKIHAKGNISGKNGNLLNRFEENSAISSKRQRICILDSNGTNKELLGERIGKDFTESRVNLRIKEQRNKKQRMSVCFGGVLLVLSGLCAGFLVGLTVTWPRRNQTASDNKQSADLEESKSSHSEEYIHVTSSISEVLTNNKQSADLEESKSSHSEEYIHVTSSISEVLTNISGWAHYGRGSSTGGGSKYHVIDRSMSFYRGQEWCQRLGGHLAHINTLREQLFLEDFIRHIINIDGQGSVRTDDGSIGLWIGGKRSRGSHDGTCMYDQWKWIDPYGRARGTISGLTAFLPGSPDNQYSPEECLYMSYRNTTDETRFLKWDDASCEQTTVGSIKVLCEVETESVHVTNPGEDMNHSTPQTTTLQSIPA